MLHVSHCAKDATNRFAVALIQLLFGLSCSGCADDDPVPEHCEVQFDTLKSSPAPALVHNVGTGDILVFAAPLSASGCDKPLFCMLFRDPNADTTLADAERVTPVSFDSEFVEMTWSVPPGLEGCHKLVLACVPSSDADNSNEIPDTGVITWTVSVDGANGC